MLQNSICQALRDRISGKRLKNCQLQPQIPTPWNKLFLLQLLNFYFIKREIPIPCQYIPGAQLLSWAFRYAWHFDLPAEIKLFTFKSMQINLIMSLDLVPFNLHIKVFTRRFSLQFFYQKPPRVIWLESGKKMLERKINKATLFSPFTLLRFTFNFLMMMIIFNVN